MSEKIEEEIQKNWKKIFPLQNILIRKVKMIKRPNYDP